ncbi:glycosyltransferase [Butyrivibrio sp. CB08]|uniref:glycosyltransferase family 2 protein n=1 Tax=Butyrivibrio sp. CB08 TaxID=2364879 RepID=UPI000EA90E8B|nr:glycosyltransferase [Butyrivibrio sp. CB08]RKM57814.1 glycosyltransferase [Butyrivibrio sp. CB08]
MSIRNAVTKTIAYARRNGYRAAFFAALERLSLNRKEKYTFVPLSEAVIREQKQEYKLLAESGCLLRFSIVVPLFNTSELYLRAMIESVIAQTYGNWELVLSDASLIPDVGRIVAEYSKDDPRIKYVKLDKNGGISDNTNPGIEKATGDYIGLLDHDDVLTPDALYEMSRVIRKSMQSYKLVKFSDCPVRLIYSDEDKFDDVKGRYYECHKKPSFNMDYLFSNNYICHFTMLRADVIKRLKLRSKYDGAQDYDLFLRACTESCLQMPLAANQIVHIDKVLYHWRCHQGSTAANPASKSYAYEAGRLALQDVAERYGMAAKAAHLQHVGFYRLDYDGLAGDGANTNADGDAAFFKSRPDVGCIGGKILDKKNRICGGMYRKDGTLAFAGLPEGYSGGLQHRAVLQQDSYAVDIRCIAVRDDLVQAFEDATGIKYVNGLTESDAGVNAVLAALPQEEIVKLSLKFAAEVHKRGLRVMWDPKFVTKCAK